MSYWQRLFYGRLGRLNYFLSMVLLSLSSLLYVIPVLISGVTVGVSGGDKSVSSTAVIFLAMITLVYFVMFGLYSISFQTKRLHDLNQSGWLQLLGLVPLVNVGLSIYMTFFRGTEGQNNYGEPDGNFNMNKLLGMKTTVQPALRSN